MKKLIHANLVILVLLFSGCATVDRGNFGSFKRSLNNTFYGYEIVEDHTKRAPAKYIERFEVRHGDCAADTGWSDCAQDRERSELSGSKDNYPGTEYWYGWSIYVPEDYVNISPTKVALGQFHQKSSHPVWMFQNSTGGYHLDKQVSGYTDTYYKLIDKKDFRGKWHKIKLHVKWSRKNDGFFKVWVNGKQKVDYKGKTMSASQVYFKYGVYRSFMSRYKNSKKSEWIMNLPKGADISNPPKFKVPTQVVYYSNVRRASNEEGLSMHKNLK